MLKYTTTELWKAALLKGQLQNVATQLTYRQKLALLEELSEDIWNSLIEINQNYYVKEVDLSHYKSSNQEFYFQLPYDFYKEIAIQRKMGASYLPIMRENIISRDGGYMLLPDTRDIRLHYNAMGDMGGIHLTYIRQPRQMTFPAAPILLPQLTDIEYINLQKISPNNRCLIKTTSQTSPIEYDIQSGTIIPGTQHSDYIYGGNEYITNGFRLSDSGGEYAHNGLIYTNNQPVSIQDFLTNEGYNISNITPLTCRRYAHGFISYDTSSVPYYISQESDPYPLDFGEYKDMVITDNYIFILNNRKLTGQYNFEPKYRLDYASQNDQYENIERLYGAITDPNTGFGLAIKDGRDGKIKITGFAPDCLVDFPHKISWNYAILSLAIKISRDLDKNPSEQIQASAASYKQQMLNEAMLDITPTTISRSRPIISRTNW